MNMVCPEAPDTPPETPLYNQELFLEQVSVAEEEIAAAALYRYDSVERAITVQRPFIQKYSLHAYGNPSESTEPVRYYEALWTAELTLRRAVLRGIGYLTITPLLTNAIEIIDKGVEPISTKEQPFVLDATRGRVHVGKRGQMVHATDAILRSICDTALTSLDPERLQEDIAPAFVDTTHRVRSYARKILDLKFGDAWQELDPKLVTSMQVKHINGKKISRRDQLLLLCPIKTTDIHQSVSDAVAAAAEFTAISIEHMQKALAKADVPSSAWYHYAFANLSKVGFAAHLPFWTAQNIGMHANDPDAAPIFDTVPLGNGVHDIIFSDPSHQKYYDKGLRANCPGAIPPQRVYMRQDILRAMSNFIDRLGNLSCIDGVQLQHDWSTNASFKPVTGAEAATAVSLSFAYSNRYNFVED